MKSQGAAKNAANNAAQAASADAAAQPKVEVGSTYSGGREALLKTEK